MGAPVFLPLINTLKYVRKRHVCNCQLCVSKLLNRVNLAISLSRKVCLPQNKHSKCIYIMSCLLTSLPILGSVRKGRGQVPHFPVA